MVVGGTGRVFGELDGPAEKGVSCSPSFSRRSVSPLIGDAYAGGGSQ